MSYAGLTSSQRETELHSAHVISIVPENSGEQDERDNFFSVVDLHAITVPQDPKKLTEGVLSAAATYLAAGIDPAKSTVFVQVCRCCASFVMNINHTLASAWTYRRSSSHVQQARTGHLGQLERRSLSATIPSHHSTLDESNYLRGD